MSKGSPFVSLRISQALLDEIESEIAKRAELTTVVPWTRTDFILAAIREKLAHMKRSRKGKKRSENDVRK